MSNEPNSNVTRPEALVSWFKLTVLLTVSFTAITMLLLIQEYDEAKSFIEILLFFIVIWAIPSALIAVAVKSVPWFRERPSRFLILPAFMLGLFFYMTGFYFDDQVEIVLPDQTGSVTYSQKSEMSLIESNYYYYRTLEFQSSGGSSIEVKMEPNMDHETNIAMSWSNGVIRFQDKYDTAWIDTNNMCGNATGNSEATLPEKKCHEGFSQITSWQELGIISDKSSDGLALVTK
jgi:hypothetical protein